MSLSYITISYHIISHVFLFYLFCCFDLHSILFYSTLFQIDSILFYSIEFDLLYCSVLFISMNDLCLSVRPSVCLFVSMNKYLFSLLFLFSFISLSLLFSYERLPHTHTHTDTDTQKHMNICSFL